MPIRLSLVITLYHLKTLSLKAVFVFVVVDWAEKNKEYR